METTDQFLEPLKYYEHGLKDLHRQNVEEFFEGLTKDSKVDTGENKVTCTKYYQEKAKLDKKRKSLTAVKVGIVFMVIILIVGFVLGVILLVGGINNVNGVLIGVGIGLIAVGITALVLLLTVFRKNKKNLEAIVKKLEETVRKLQDEAYTQMAPLNALFNPKMSPQLMEKSAPLIDFDDYLSSKTEERIVEQFGDSLDTSNNRSTLVVQSGNVNTNPFLLRQVYVMEMRPETYTGHLVITYTRVVSDGKGGSRTITVTQTLTASIQRPKPHYGVETSLTYYSDAADSLSFYRKPAGLAGKSEKQIQKAVEKEDKENSKKAAKAMKKGETYAKFANSKFEAFINSEGRDNEMEYRLLFTPLAQNNFVYSFSKHDDIYFTKNKCINIISSSHDVGMDYSGDASNYVNFDYEVIRKNFINYNMSFFEGLYYDFIPLLNIPLYQQHKSAKFTSSKEEDPISYYESEVLVNKFDPNDFRPENCDTNIILKTALKGRTLYVTAHGFHADPRTELVPVMGGDGFMHPVPVPYYEYIPVSGVNTVNLINKTDEKVDNNNDSVINYRRFIACLLLSKI